jgi:predicted Fe-S protein YdhL (DUF1289 family)
LKINYFDKSSLSLALKETQIGKGTYDSPCMSVCDFNPETDQCATCLMFKAEKTKWKTGSETDKDELAKMFIERIEQKDSLKS